MEIEAARHNMITQQIRACDVLDEHLLNTLRSTPRELFVPSNLKNLAFSDQRLPLAHEQTMMSPVEESKMLQALNIQESDRILEIGTGTGFVTALLAKLGNNVITVDIFKDFTQNAKQLIAQCGIHNVSYRTQDGVAGLPKEGPFDVICVTGSIPEQNDALREQLNVGGRLFVIIGETPVMQATLIHRLSETAWDDTILFETNLTPLIHAIKKEQFIF